MLSTDRGEFEIQLGALCAGFNVPATKDRQEAYWTGLAKMSLSQFVRVVSFALGEAGPERFPTVNAVWQIHKKARHNTEVKKQNVPQIEDQDHLLFFANRMFFKHMVNRGGLGSIGTFVEGYGMRYCKSSDELRSARKAVRDLVDYFSGPICDGDDMATPAEFVAQLIVALDRVSKIDAKTITAWGQMVKHPDAHKPFAPHMGRPLPEKYASREMS